MPELIYIETTIPSYYYSLRSDSLSEHKKDWTRRWWNEFGPTYELATSVAVIHELERGTSEATEDRIKLLDGLLLLDVTEETEQIVERYIQERVMPADPTGDALHLAVSSMSGADFLLTWNCRHLANPNKMRHIRRVNMALGLETPEIVTPFVFFE